MSALWHYDKNCKPRYKDGTLNAEWNIHTYADFANHTGDIILMNGAGEHPELLNLELVNCDLDHTNATDPWDFQEKWENDTLFYYPHGKPELDSAIQEIAIEDNHIIISYDDDHERFLEYTPENLQKWKDAMEEQEDPEHWNMEIYQWYAVSSDGARFIQNHTNELLFYSDILNVNILGVCHFGTPWDSVPAPELH